MARPDAARSQGPRWLLLAGAGVAALGAAFLFEVREAAPPEETACSSCDARHQGLEKRRAAIEKLRARDGD